ncbi:TPA: hypothetical protein RMI67_003237 [Bacillus cereus]|nr:hypothetical protein [Bacillus cereus]
MKKQQVSIFDFIEDPNPVIKRTRKKKKVVPKHKVLMVDKEIFQPEKANWFQSFGNECTKVLAVLPKKISTTEWSQFIWGIFMRLPVDHGENRFEQAEKILRQHKKENKPIEIYIVKRENDWCYSRTQPELQVIGYL